jgi:hypothetical protein
MTDTNPSRKITVTPTELEPLLFDDHEVRISDVSKDGDVFVLNGLIFDKGVYDQPVILNTQATGALLRALIEKNPGFGQLLGLVPMQNKYTRAQVAAIASKEKEKEKQDKEKARQDALAEGGTDPNPSKPKGRQKYTRLATEWHTGPSLIDQKKVYAQHKKPGRITHNEAENLLRLVLRYEEINQKAGGVTLKKYLEHTLPNTQFRTDDAIRKIIVGESHQEMSLRFFPQIKEMYNRLIQKGGNSASRNMPPWFRDHFGATK